MAQLFPLCYDPATCVGYRVARTPKGERLEKFRVTWAGSEVAGTEVRVVLRRADRSMSAAVYNRGGFPYHDCDTEVF